VTEKKTAEELQAAGQEIAHYGGCVAYIHPSEVERYTAWQMPHIVIQQIPTTRSCGQSTMKKTAAYWERIATERLRVLWIIAHANGDRFAVGKSAAEEYPGDDVAMVLTHTDPQFGDFIIEARRR
jgi:hypothetical protein